MNETFFTKKMGCEFEKIPVGSVFIYCKEIYYKTGSIFCVPYSSDGEVIEYNCLNLETNELYYFDSEAPVCTLVKNVICE